MADRVPRVPGVLVRGFRTVAVAGRPNTYPLPDGIHYHRQPLPPAIRGRDRNQTTKPDLEPGRVGGMNLHVGMWCPLIQQPGSAGLGADVKLVDRAPGDEHEPIIARSRVWLPPPVRQPQERLAFGIDPRSRCGYSCCRLIPLLPPTTPCHNLPSWGLASSRDQSLHAKRLGDKALSTGIVMTRSSALSVNESKGFLR